MPPVKLRDARASATAPVPTPPTANPPRDATAAATPAATTTTTGDLFETASQPGIQIPGTVTDPAKAFSEHNVRAYVAQLGNALLETAGSGTVSVQETQKFLLQIAKDLNFEAYYALRNWNAANTSKLSPDAQSVMKKFIEVDAPPRLVRDPVHGMAPGALTAEPAFPADWAAHGVQYGVAPNAANMVGTVPANVDDLMQGHAGVCYFDSVVEGLVVKDPEFYMKMIRKNDDGTFSTTFNVMERDGATPHPVDVTVSGALPVAGGQLVGTRNRNPASLDAAIYEKLWVAFKGGYDAAAGGIATDAMLAITGKPATVTPIFSDSQPDVVFETIAAAQARGDLMVADTYVADPTGASDSDAGTFGSINLIPDHAYSVFGAQEVDGKKFVELRNPWGRVEPGTPDLAPADGRDDGRFLMPLEQFITYFAGFQSGPR